MPYKDKKIYNKYLNEYMNKRYHQRMAKAKIQLGGRCVVCGTTDNLEFDQIDPSTKLYSIGKRAASLSEKRFQEELAKCQLLCHEHHLEKTLSAIS